MNATTRILLSAASVCLTATLCAGCASLGLPHLPGAVQSRDPDSHSCAPDNNRRNDVYVSESTRYKELSEYVSSTQQHIDTWFADKGGMNLPYTKGNAEWMSYGEEDLDALAEDLEMTGVGIVDPCAIDAQLDPLEQRWEEIRDTFNSGEAFTSREKKGYWSDEAFERILAAAVSDAHRIAEAVSAVPVVRGADGTYLDAINNIAAAGEVTLGRGRESLPEDCQLGDDSAGEETMGLYCPGHNDMIFLLGDPASEQAPDIIRHELAHQQTEYICKTTNPPTFRTPLKDFTEGAVNSWAQNYFGAKIARWAYMQPEEYQMNATTDAMAAAVFNGECNTRIGW